MSYHTVEYYLDRLPGNWNGFMLRISWEQLNYKTKEGQWHVAYWELGFEDEIRGQPAVDKSLNYALDKFYKWAKKDGITV